MNYLIIEMKDGERICAAYDYLDEPRLAAKRVAVNYGYNPFDILNFKMSQNFKNY